MWCVPRLDREYVERMEDVLNTLSRPLDPREPVVALDERPVVLHDSARIGRPAAPGKLARQDYEYVRRGTANVYCIASPRGGQHWTHATPNRKAEWFVRALRRVARSFPRARKIHLILDNLNIHRESSLRNVLGPRDARRLWRRFEVHYTPKHASWLDPAEIEVSLWSRECLGRDRVGDLAELRRRTRAWNARANRQKRTIDWRFTTADARRVFRYRRFTTHEARH
jgi:hypothetical protein